MMMISIDSGDPEKIGQVAKRWKFPIDKVTTNPTTISETIRRRGGTVRDIVLEIRSIVGNGIPISVETTGAMDYNPKHMDPDYFVAEAEEIASWDPNFVIKIPAVPEGLEAARRLGGRYDINFTLVFSRHQGHLAAVYGGRYASPFVGRIDAKLAGKGIKREGMDLVKEMADDYRRDEHGTYVLTASTRTNIKYLKKASGYGSHVVTMPYEMFEMLNTMQGFEGLSFINGIRRSTQPYTPERPRKPSYDMEFDWSLLAPWEKELVDEGLFMFLRDAQLANYRIV